MANAKELNVPVCPFIMPILTPPQFAGAPAAVTFFECRNGHPTLPGMDASKEMVCAARDLCQNAPMLLRGEERKQ